MKQEQMYNFNVEEDRFKYMNKIYIFTTSIMWFLFLFYLFMKYLNHNTSNLIIFSSFLWVIASMVINLFLYKKRGSSKSLNSLVLLEFLIIFLLLGFRTNGEFPIYCMLGVVGLQIPYYELKKLKRVVWIFGVTLFVVINFRIVTKMVPQDVDALIRAFCSYLVLFMLYKVGLAAKAFSDAALSAVEEQTKKQSEIMDSILSISETVQKESSKSTSLVNELVTLSDSVATNISGIANASNTTYQSIENQNSMTHDIQEAIDNTISRSRKMVEIATASNDCIQENLEVMDELTKQSEEISTTNQELTDSMSRLQQKTAEVENITEMILDISSQTNLLALNASIESARAGEAGRGFAVVAEQIRQLADQTRTCTEDIAKIAAELRTNSNDAVQSIENTVLKNQNQYDKVMSASESFHKLTSDISELIQDIHVIDQQITGLAETNSKIVDNISELSAATQEVTANAEEVKKISDKNLSYAEEVKNAITLIGETTQGMKKYL